MRNVSDKICMKIQRLISYWANFIG